MLPQELGHKRKSDNCLYPLQIARVGTWNVITEVKIWLLQQHYQCLILEQCRAPLVVRTGQDFWFSFSFQNGKMESEVTLQGAADT